ncbi:MAG: DNA-processing protein DprA, partial [Anaerolineaceae bacterium]|nr:DNA-processing protein DprA [Anaerolineaceae bacterium]
MEEKVFWVGFNHDKGIGAVRLKSLLDFFGNLSTAWNAPSSALRNAGLSEKIVERFNQFRNDIDLDVLYENVHQSGVKVVTWVDDGYPKRLREIDQAPPVLYIRGSIILEDEWAVAIVGTRRMTGYGRQVSNEIASFLARNGVTVVSGLARGVDGMAHQSALNAGGRT